MIYIFYLLILLLLLIFERSRNTKSNVFRYLIPLVYILLVGLRGANVGIDTPVYYQHYYMYGEWGCDFVEIGFDWLNRILYKMGCSHVPFFLICAAMTIIPVVKVAGKYLSRHEYSLFMLLFCTTTFVSFCNGMRQNIACGLFFAVIFWFLNTKIILYKKVIYYILLIYIISLFHTSVFFVAPLVFIKYVCFSKKTYALIYALSFVFVFVNVSSFIPVLNIAGRDYGQYLGSDLMNGSASFLGFSITSLRNILIFYLLIKIKAYRKYPLWSNFVLLFFVLTNIGFNIPLMGRINMYFLFFYIFILAKLLGNYRDLKSQKIVILLTSIIIVLTVHSLISPTNKVIDYMFFWENSNYMKVLSV